MFRILHNKEFWLDAAYYTYYQFIETSWTFKYNEEYNTIKTHWISGGNDLG